MRASRVWLIAGLALFALMVSLLWLSPHFRYERDIARMPVLTLVGILVLAGVGLSALSALIERSNPSRVLLVWIVGLGLLSRLVLMPSIPMLEDDFYRYLWDGAVLSEGLSPYQHSPVNAQRGEGPPALVELADNTPLIVERINYPDLKTVYPPVAELGFVVAHWLKPWSLMAWKVVLLVAECATLWLLLAILKYIGRSPLWVTLYWWNPLVIKEFFNSAHVDALMIPFVLGALLLSLRQRTTLACISLALATGIKIWPLLLLPVVLKASASDRRWRGGCIFLGLLGLQCLPVVMSGAGETSGFLAYARVWEMNDALFMAIDWVIDTVGSVFGLAGEQTALLSRFVVGLVALGVSIAVSFRSHTDTDVLIGSFLLVTTVVFLLSPTQFPWYYSWLVPFLVLRPCFPLLLLTPLLCLYYSRFYFVARGHADVFDFGVVWLEYAPVWLLLGWLGVKQRMQQHRHA